MYKSRDACCFLFCHSLGQVLQQVEAGQRYELSQRASEIDAAAQEHPELGFVFSDPKTGKPC
jgi:hypothetical protein